ncbi:leucine-rich repeat domain-containing protein [Wenyingzhuangia sp. IMCC45574]
MNQKLLITFTFILTLNSLLFSQNFTDNGIKYNITSPITPLTVEVSGGSVANIVIPNSVTHMGQNYTVTAIGNDAFYYIGGMGEEETTVSIESVTIPNTVTSIGHGAFFGNSLTTLNLPNSVISIGNSAFTENGLTTVAIPNSVTNIGGYAFGNNQLTTLTLPKSVTSIGIYAFAINPLTSIVSESKNPDIITNKDVFSNFNTIDLTIPTGTSAAYSAAGWIGFKSTTEDPTLSSKEIVLDKDISIAITSYKISVSNLTNVITEEIIIYNAVGKNVKSKKGEHIDIYSLSAGLYVLQLKTNKGVFSKKFAK